MLEQVTVEQGDAGDQKVHLHTTLPGRLILHWGVEGGQDYQGGWRLPGSTARPDGTTQYKDRALQTPWQYVLPHNTFSWTAMPLSSMPWRWA